VRDKLDVDSGQTTDVGGIMSSKILKAVLDSL
jgi:hypothetical protein